MTYLFFSILFLLAAIIVPIFLKQLRQPILIGGLIMSVLSLIPGLFFMAEPGYNYTIRTITGNQIIITDSGWQPYIFGTIEPWKKAISIATTNDKAIDESAISVLRGCWNVTMLDKVAGCLSTTVRFRMPDDKESMLKLANEYRNQSNLVNTALIPSIDGVMNNTAQLMSAENFFNGGRSTFESDFNFQMRNGSYIVKRVEKRSPLILAKNSTVTPPTTDKNGTQVENQSSANDNIANAERVVLEIERVKDENGQDLIRKHNFLKFGVVVEDAIVTNFLPNSAFIDRMANIQKAAADKAQAIEDRFKMQEQTALAVQEGLKQQAEATAAALKEQAKLQTEALTQKNLAIIEAERKKEQAEIEQQTAQITLEKDRLTAQSIKTLADAKAYEMERTMAANNALQQKLEAEIEIQKVWANAYSVRPVPQIVIGSGNTPNGNPANVGSNEELRQLVTMKTLEMAERLNYDRAVKDTK